MLNIFPYIWRERDSTANEVKRLRNDFDRYLKAMQEMMFQHVSGPGSILREEAFISVCDLLIFFCANGDEGKFLNILLILTQILILPGSWIIIIRFFLTPSSEELNFSSSGISPGKTNGSVT